MTEELVSTKQAAAIYGCKESSTFSKLCLTKRIDFVELRGTTKMWRLSDVEMLTTARDRRREANDAKAAAASEKKDREAKQKADAALLQGLADDGDGPRRKPDGKNMCTPLDVLEKAVVYAAFKAKTLGPGSAWKSKTPPASYRLAYEAREEARAAMAIEELVAA